jgi:hypothetical protein
MAKTENCCIILLCIVFSACVRFHGSNSDLSLTTDSVVVYRTQVQVDTLDLCLDSAEAHESFLDTLNTFIGIKELTNRNDHPKIDLFFDETCGLRRNPWCGAVLSYGLKQNGFEIPELPCWSPSFFPAGRVTWKKGSNEIIKEGRIFGMYFSSKKRVAHVGAIRSYVGGGWYQTYEGNTNDDGSRTGNEFLPKLRHVSQIYVAADWTTKKQ